MTVLINTIRPRTYSMLSGRILSDNNNDVSTPIHGVLVNHVFYGSNCYFKFNSSFSEASGWDETGTTWQLVKDSYLKLVYQRDYGTEWTNGRLTSTERVSGHDIQTMVNRLSAVRTLNGLDCAQCHERTDMKAHSTISDFPTHLILTLKRIWFDWKSQTAHKTLYDLQIQATVQIEACTYGLYAIVVHVGVSVNSGHYYTFARDNRITRHLLQHDSPYAPWMKFNDMKVSVSSWNEIAAVSDAVYLLFYKRIDNRVGQDESDVEGRRGGMIQDDGLYDANQRFIQTELLPSSRAFRSAYYHHHLLG